VQVAPRVEEEPFLSRVSWVIPRRKHEPLEKIVVGLAEAEAVQG
jgi:hypothetical protein